MDIVFSDKESRHFITSDPASDVIYIMKNKHWKDPMKFRPSYKNTGYTSAPLNEFMIYAFNWENFLHALYDIDDHPSKLVHFLLDVYVCSMKRYHDIFSDLFKVYT